MAVVKEYRCAAHGPFEGTEQACPYGCPPRFVVREFRSAPAFQAKRTRNIDGTLRGIASDFGLTDMKNDPKGGVSVMQALRSGKVQRSNWLKLNHAEPGFSSRGDQAPVFKPESMGFQPPERPMVDNIPAIRPKFQARWDGN
jgi:hypothetical protein